MADPLEENFNEHQPLNINANYEISNDRKPIHTLILDAGPLLKNTPPLSTLLAQSVELLTTPSVISEIRDPDARNRIDTFYLPFLKQRKPSSKSVSVVSEFARKTGDRPVLSTTDIELIALAHEVECERNGGDWRLRSVPGQKTLNGKPPSALATSTATAQEEEKKEVTDADDDNDDHGDNGEKDTMIRTTATNTDEVSRVMENLGTIRFGEAEEGERTEELPQPLVETEPVDDSLTEVELGGAKENDNEIEAVVEDKSEDHGKGDSGSDSEGGWITPSNYKKHQAQDEALSDAPEPKFMQVAMITTDFACQNVLLQMNLNLLSTTTLQRIKHLKTYIKRCHACFFTTKEMHKQFCPRCGKDSLTRVSCSTNANGQFTLHLKKNMQWNTRGSRYSIPKPVHGNASGKWKSGGGKGGWGTELILAEDQKEYARAMVNEQRQARKERNLMDEDYLPSILTGERQRTGGRIKVGAGRNVNSKKR